jgi:hypothetical protein
LGSEILVDESKIHTPQMHLLLDAIGERVAQGSPWFAVNKKMAEFYALAVKKMKKAA